MSLLTLSTACFAEDANLTLLGRFLAVENKPLVAQHDLLQQTFQVHFPYSVKTIGQAINYLLRFSGYSLVNANQLSTDANHLLQLPLPNVGRTLGPLSLEKGLETLVGDPFQLLVDPVHRQVSFQLKSAYQLLFKKAVTN